MVFQVLFHDLQSPDDLQETIPCDEKCFMHIKVRVLDGVGVNSVKYILSIVDATCEPRSVNSINNSWNDKDQLRRNNEAAHDECVDV